MTQITTADLPLPSFEGKKVVYFAHSRKLYGSKEADDCRAHILRIPDCVILDPETIDWQKSKELAGSFKKATAQVMLSVDMVITVEYQEFVGKGVFEELITAHDMDIPCMVIRNNELVEIDDLVVNDENDWQLFYGKVLAKGETHQP